MSFDSARPFQRLPGKRPFVVGHRGARAHCPENTMVAFERALDDGADGVELDVRMSADGQLFISHDPSVETLGGAALLGRLSEAQIRKLPTTHGEPIPTLKEVLELQARTGAYMNIELKGDVASPIWMARRAAQMIREHGGSGIILSSFAPLQVYTLAKALPDVPVAQLFESLIGFTPGLSVLGRSIKLLGAKAAHPKWDMLDQQTITALRRHVAVINTWTVNSAEEARRLSQIGVDAIITDDPAFILRSLLA